MLRQKLAEGWRGPRGAAGEEGSLRWAIKGESGANGLHAVTRKKIIQKRKVLFKHGVGPTNNEFYNRYLERFEWEKLPRRFTHWIDISASRLLLLGFLLCRQWEIT